MQTATSEEFATTLRRTQRLTLFFIGLVLAGCAATDAEWNPAAYQEAVARADDDEMGRQRRAADRDRASVGLTRRRVRALLGKPLRVRRVELVDEFDAGWVNNTFALGDQNILEAEYDAETRRIV